MKIAIISEGTRDYGDDRLQGNKGALRVIVDRLLGSPGYIELVGRHLAHTHRRGGLSRKVEFSVREAHRSGFDGVALVVDNDRCPPSKKINDLRAGCKVAAVPVPAALGVAIQEFEAWMLADEKGLRQALSLKKTPKPLPKLEAIASPKQMLADVAQRRVVGRDLASIAGVCDLQKLKKRCPKGFGLFAREVATELMPLVSRSKSSRTK